MRNLSHDHDQDEAEVLIGYEGILVWGLDGVAKNLDVGAHLTVRMQWLKLMNIF